MEMTRPTTTFLLSVLGIILGLACASEPINPREHPKVLVEEMVEAVGGTDRLYELKDVEYTYTYHDLATDKKDVSLERYVFGGELSWAKFEVREKSALPEIPGEIIQGYNGNESWMTIDGELVEGDPRMAKFSDFVRKTNYYWFTMMFKLLDPGVNHQYNGTKSFDGIDYDLVKITFTEGVGDAQDTYMLYINPKTKLVDQFLFTVMDFGLTVPLLMKVKYEEVEGLKLPTQRKYVRANWQGEPQDDTWTAEISTNIKFNNGFSRSLFERPTT